MNKKRILLVDDDADQRLSVRLPLEAAGYEVAEAANFDQGLAAVKQLKPDLIVLDVMMDTTTAGFQFALTLRNADAASEYAAFKNLPIVMLTAIHSTTSLRFTPDEDYLPVQTFLEKPVDPQTLLATIKHHLEG
ncbi:MAG: response regulator [Anaerolineales bacterium]|nr:response regulator [Anaerolineales bacterium]MCZ2289760.1 response regulator [Anaerolineales bacterium]